MSCRNTICKPLPDPLSSQGDAFGRALQTGTLGKFMNRDKSHSGCSQHRRGCREGSPLAPAKTLQGNGSTHGPKTNLRGKSTTPQGQPCWRGCLMGFVCCFPVHIPWLPDRTRCFAVFIPWLPGTCHGLATGTAPAAHQNRFFCPVS